jgi:hypothetical protein
MFVLRFAMPMQTASSEETEGQQAMTTPPSSTVCNGRGARGRFAPGNKAAKGNGIARKVTRFRTSMFAAVKAGDVKEIVAELLRQAKAGEGWAVKLALEYLCGPPTDTALEERLAILEETIFKKESR